MIDQKITAILLTALTISACSVAPTVRYTTINSSNDTTGNEADFFYLQSSTVSVASTRDPVSKAITDFSIQSTPIESTSKRLSITRDDPFYAKTTMNITKLPNTDLIKEIDTDVKDHRIAIITTVGTLISKVAAYAANVNEIDESKLPLKIDMTQSMSTTGRESRILHDSNGITTILGPVPTEAKPVSELPTNKVNYAIYAACRQATVAFKHEGIVYSKNLKISDPRYFQYVAFPVKGKVAFHSECGVSTTNEKDASVSTSSEIADALVIQGKAIKDAIDAAKKDDKK